jgi:RimJ/RimL family protein N-acetyltransferase
MSSIQPQTFTARSGQQFTIRTAHADDAAAMLTYIRSVAGETEFFILEPDEFPETEEQERKWLQDHLDHPGQIVLLAEASGTIIGNVSFENGPHRRIAHRGTLGIAVVKEWREQGVATALLRILLDWAMANPLIEKVCLEVFATNVEAIRLYRKLGFVEEGVRPKDIKRGTGQYVDTVAMGRFVK